MKTTISILILLLLISCDIKKKETIEVKKTKDVELEYVKDSSFQKGDVRRYGVFPNKKINQKYLNNIVELANNGQTITFPKGNYKTRLFLKGITNASFIFNDASFDALYVTEDDSIESQKIDFKGHITLFDKLFIRKSSQINFEDLLIKSDTSKNSSHQNNRGASIYAGSKNIHFNTLEINDTGGDKSDYFKNTTAALQIHGWNNNPNDVSIDDLKITNAARSAVYLTGNNNHIKKALIQNFGFGSSKNITGLGDAKKGDEKDFTGFWINKCNSCNIDSLVINSNKGKYSLHLDKGISSKPTFISNIHFNKKAKKMKTKSHKLTNVLVENEY
jgi:hypothetical protein